MACFSNDGEPHGALGHGQLAALVPCCGPSQLPELLGHGQKKCHGHQTRSQRRQRRDQVKTLEEHGCERPGTVFKYLFGVMSTTVVKPSQEYMSDLLCKI